MDIANIITGIMAIITSTLLSIILVFVLYKLDIMLTVKINEEKQLLEGKKSTAIVLGAVIISRALLMRHALHPVMVVIRNAFVNKISDISVLWTIIYCIVFIVIIAVVSFIVVGFTLWLFSKINRKIDEREEVLKDNVAVAIFLGAVVIAVTLIIDRGVEDLAQSIIPTVKRGVILIK